MLLENAFHHDLNLGSRTFRRAPIQPGWPWRPSITQDDPEVGAGAVVVVETGAEELEPVVEPDAEVAVDGVAHSGAD